MLMRGRDYHHRSARRFTRSDASGRIFEHQTVIGAPSELARGELITRRIGLASGNILGGDEHTWWRQARRGESSNRKRTRRRCHDGPAILRQLRYELACAGNRMHALDVVDLGKCDGMCLGDRIDAGDIQLTHRIDRTLTVNAMQKRARIDPELSGPARPDSFGGLDGAEQRAIHVEQQGRERTAVEQSIELSHSSAGLQDHEVN